MAQPQDFICNRCAAEFSGTPKLQFAGFGRVTCTECESQFGIPLSPTMQAIWWVLAAATILSFFAMILMGFIAIPGLVAVVSVAVLLVDRVRRNAGLGKSSDPDLIRTKHSRRSTVAIVWCAAIVQIGCAVFATALVTVEQHVVVDEPEQPETFHSETYETGRTNVDLSWPHLCSNESELYTCINALVDNYNAHCADKYLSEQGQDTCSDVLGRIDAMKARQAPPGSTVGKGSWILMTLNSHKETATREVSNNDYVPAITHEGACYLGFIGECQHD